MHRRLSSFLHTAYKNGGSIMVSLKHVNFSDQIRQVIVSLVVFMRL